MRDELVAITIGVLLAAVAFFIKRLIDRVDKIYADYLKFFGKEGEKHLIWKRLDKHRHDILWLEVVMRRNLKDIPEKKDLTDG